MIVLVQEGGVGCKVLEFRLREVGFGIWRIEVVEWVGIDLG